MRTLTSEELSAVCGGGGSWVGDPPVWEESAPPPGNNMAFGDGFSGFSPDNSSSPDSWPGDGVYDGVAYVTIGGSESADGGLSSDIFGSLGTTIAQEIGAIGSSATQIEQAVVNYGQSAAQGIQDYFDAHPAGGFYGTAGGTLPIGLAGVVTVGPNLDGGSSPDIYLHLGVGVPGVTVAGGYTNNASGYLTNWSGEAGNVVHLGFMTDGSLSAVQVGNPGISGSFTYGVDISQSLRNDFQTLAGQLGPYLNPLAHPNAQ